MTNESEMRYEFKAIVPYVMSMQDGSIKVWETLIPEAKEFGANNRGK